MPNLAGSRRARWRGAAVLAAVAAGLLAALPFATARAAIINVTTTADELNADGDCSLREAIRSANLDASVDACTAGSGIDTIFVPAGTYTLALAGADDTAIAGDLDITSAVILSGAGAGATIINANNIDRVFQIGNSVLVSDLTVTGGNTLGNGGGFLVTNGGSLTLNNVTVRDNRAANGGGLHVSGGVSMSNSTVSGNTATGEGGGFHNSFTLVLNNSTVSGNAANGSGGGFYNTNSSGVITLSNVTVSANRADADSNASGSGGGIANLAPAAVDFKNTLVGGNTGPAASPDCSGTLNSLGYNLIQDTSGCVLSGSSAGNVTGQSAALGALQNNGGATATHALLFGSPAIDSGNPAGCTNNTGAALTTDQRGSARPQGGRCDMGAYESPFTATPTATATFTATRTHTATHTATPSPTPTATPIANFVVNTTTDAVDANLADGLCLTAANECSLRAAIQQANASAGSDVIALPPGTYGLSLAGSDDVGAVGDLDLNTNITLFGGGADNTFVEANIADRIFDIGPGANVNLSSLTVRNGDVPGDGGGIENSGTLVINALSITNNEATAPGSNGGGVYNDGTATINESVIYNNRSLGGGGLTNTGTLYLNNSTVSGNTASIGSGGGLTGFGVYVISSSTIANNHADDQGGGIWANGAPLLRNSIVSGNTAATGPDCNGVLTSGGYNVVGSTAGCTFVTSAGDLTNTNPLLGGLQNNGGPTFTHAIGSSSPAIDAGNPGGCTTGVGAALLYDQRGQTQARHIDGDGNGSARCDAGAFESVDVPTPTFTPSHTATNTATFTSTATRTNTATNTLSPTATFTASRTNTSAPSNTVAASATATRTNTLAATATRTLTATSGSGGGGSGGAAATATRTPTRTATGSGAPSSPTARPTFARTAATETTGTPGDGSGGGDLNATEIAATETAQAGQLPTPTRQPTLPAELIGSQPVGSAGGTIDCPPWSIVIGPEIVPDGSGVRCSASTVAAQPGGVAHIGGATEVRVFDRRGVAALEFAAPVQICLSYTDEDVQAASGNTSNFVIMIVDFSGQWQELAATADTAARLVCAETSYPGKLALFSRLAPVAPEDNTAFIIAVGVGVLALLAAILVVGGLLLTRQPKPEEDTPYGF